MLIVHIILLHIVPRLIGFSLHEHDSHHSELTEYMILAGIIVFVTIAFWRRDSILQKLGRKNRFTIPQPRFIGRRKHHHHHHAHDH